MTSHSVRRQREYDRQEPIPQPNFGGPINVGPMAAAGPYAPGQQRVNWGESLEQGFQARQAQQLQNCGGWHQCQRQHEGTPMAAGPSMVTGERVNYQERLEQDFQARHNQWLQNHTMVTLMAAGSSVTPKENSHPFTYTWPPSGPIPASPVHFCGLVPMLSKYCHKMKYGGCIPITKHIFILQNGQLEDIVMSSSSLIYWITLWHTLQMWVGDSKRFNTSHMYKACLTLQ